MLIIYDSELRSAAMLLEDHIGSEFAEAIPSEDNGLVQELLSYRRVGGPNTTLVCLGTVALRLALDAGLTVETALIFSPPYSRDDQLAENGRRYQAVMRARRIGACSTAAYVQLAEAHSRYIAPLAHPVVGKAFSAAILHDATYIYIHEMASEELVGRIHSEVRSAFPNSPVLIADLSSVEGRSRHQPPLEAHGRYPCRVVHVGLDSDVGDLSVRACGLLGIAQVQVLHGSHVAQAAMRSGLVDEPWKILTGSVDLLGDILAEQEQTPRRIQARRVGDLMVDSEALETLASWTLGVGAG